jgi:hypothetical protein
LIVSSSQLEQNNNGLHRFIGFICQHAISIFKLDQWANIRTFYLLRCACGSNFIHKLLLKINSNFHFFTTFQYLDYFSFISKSAMLSYFCLFDSNSNTSIFYSNFIPCWRTWFILQLSYWLTLHCVTKFKLEALQTLAQIEIFLNHLNLLHLFGLVLTLSTCSYYFLPLHFGQI